MINDAIKEIEELDDIKEIAKRIQSKKWIVLNAYFPHPDKPVIVMGKTKQN